MIFLNELYDYIISNYDLDYLKSNYNCSLKDYLTYGLDYRYIDDIYILKMFHDIYLEVRELFDSSFLSEIKKISDKYLFLINRIYEYKESNSYIRSNFDITHEPFVDNECINYVKQSCDSFSLSEFFNPNNFKRHFCGVCLISKIQTVCMFNDDSFGYIGSGYHKDSFHDIIKAIYCEKFVDDIGRKCCETGQDIKIGFSTGNVFSNNGLSELIRVIVDVPVPINTSQLKSLELLNDELKEYKKDYNVEISAAIINYYDEDFFLEFDRCTDLEDIFEWCIVSDDYKSEYEDKKIIGFINGENGFKCDDKNRRVR